MPSAAPAQTLSRPERRRAHRKRTKEERSRWRSLETGAEWRAKRYRERDRLVKELYQIAAELEARAEERTREAEELAARAAEFSLMVEQARAEGAPVTKTFLRECRTLRRDIEGRKKLARELLEQRALIQKRAMRMHDCCRKMRLFSPNCGQGPRQALYLLCGIQGCPICQHTTAKHLGDHLFEDAQRLHQSQRKGDRWRHMVLTSRTGEGAGEAITVETIRENIRHMKRSVKELWELYLSRFCRALWVFLELSPRGMVHCHCLVLGPYISAESDKEGETLPRVWGRISGWKRESDGLGIVQVNELYYYANPLDRSKDEKDGDGCHRRAKRVGDGEPVRKAFAEIAKYVSSPKTDAPLLALFGVALRGRARKWCYGEARMKREKEPCPYCGRLDCRPIMTRTFSIGASDFIWRFEELSLLITTCLHLGAGPPPGSTARAAIDTGGS